MWVHNRYQAGHEELGLIEAASRRSEAQNAAERWLDNSGLNDPTRGIFVHDTMARRGQPSLWMMTRHRKWYVAEWRED